LPEDHPARWRQMLDEATLDGASGRPDEGLRKLQALEPVIGDDYPALRADLEKLLARHAMDEGEYLEALEGYRASIPLYERAADRGGVASSYFGAAFTHVRTGEYAEAVELFERAMEIYESLGELSRAASVKSYLAFAHISMGELAIGERLTHEALETAREVGDRHVAAEAATNLAEAARLRGAFDEARAAVRETLRWREFTGSRDVSVSQFNLALIEIGARNFDEARRLLGLAETGYRERGMRGRLPLVGFALGCCSLGSGDVAGWTRQLGMLRDVVAREDLVHADLVWLGRVAAEIAVEAGLDDVAAEANALADEQQRRLDGEAR